MNYLDLEIKVRNTQREIAEAWTGTAIVSWYGSIERQIESMVRTYDLTHNFEYVTMLQEFLKTWRANEITGSINIDTVNVLQAAAAQLATVDWAQQNYFSSLRDSLRKIKASEEELPRGTDTIDMVTAPKKRSMAKELTSPFSPPPEGEPTEPAVPAGTPPT